MGRLIDITGRIFGEWKVLRKDPERKRNKTMWICRCSCGKECSVESYELRSGATTSCGHPVTHCKYGHEFTEENTRLLKRSEKDGGGSKRQCLTCDAKNQREEQLKRRGWTTVLFENTLEAQGNKCANPACDRIIHAKLSPGHREQACADHDHNTGKPRGVLCTNCNIGLGNFMDSVNLLRGAIEYLEKFSLEAAEDVKSNQTLIVSAS